MKPIDLNLGIPMDASRCAALHGYLELHLQLFDVVDYEVTGDGKPDDCRLWYVHRVGGIPALMVQELVFFDPNRHWLGLDRKGEAELSYAKDVHYAADCPLRLLALAPAINHPWRLSVRNWWKTLLREGVNALREVHDWFGQRHNGDAQHNRECVRESIARLREIRGVIAMRKGLLRQSRN
ncbi:MAG: hypothetical protein PHE17_17665 [Thiothrix sp.]|uniref:hypothetical protein n=1 Tax=Thiothrix sp. TaxID=1032 RepID=UPI002621C22B|nr:hypothetical protein [Thiothrix sp.]MDD5394849.1 hypothetical protein [Thiothrix sp.]